MLSKAAEAALLKTLEEPPPHVVFVLATTDPQKVSETIRSRTQHLRFHLLPPDTLAEHVRWVVADAGLDLNDAADRRRPRPGRRLGPRHAVGARADRQRRRATAGDAAVVRRVRRGDHRPRSRAGRSTAMAHAVNAGHEPRTLAEALVRHLRNGFLSLMAPELRAALRAPGRRARRPGPAGSGRRRSCGRIERLGEILVELRHAPDPRVLVEVALVQLDDSRRAAADDDLGALAARRRQARAGGRADGGRRLAAVPVDPATGRAALGGRARPRPGPPPQSPLRRDPAPAPPPARSRGRRRRAPRRRSRSEWEASVRPSLEGHRASAVHPGRRRRRRRRHRHAGGAQRDPPGEVRRAPRAHVEQAWAAAAGRHRQRRARSSAGGGRADESSRRRRRRHRRRADDAIDLDDLVDVPPARRRRAIDRLAQAFPGAELDRGTLSRAERLLAAGPGAHRRARPAARHRAEVGAADRLPPAQDPGRRRRPAGQCDHRRQGQGAVLRPLLQRRRRRAVPVLRRRPPRRRGSSASSRSRATSSPSSARASSTAATTCCSGR